MTKVHIHLHGRVMMDADKWITVHPHGPNGKGAPVKIDGTTGEVKAGLGGKFTGKSISQVHGKVGLPNSRASAYAAFGGPTEGSDQPVTVRQETPRGGWTLRNKETGESMMETHDPKKVAALNTEKYEAVPTERHQQELNRAIQMAGGVQPEPGWHKQFASKEMKWNGPQDKPAEKAQISPSALAFKLKKMPTEKLKASMQSPDVDPEIKKHIKREIDARAKDEKAWGGLVSGGTNWR